MTFAASGGGSTCSYSNLGREVGLRDRMLRVQIPPSTLMHSRAAVAQRKSVTSPRVKIARSNRVNRSHAALAQFGRRHEVQALGSVSSNLTGGTMEGKPGRRANHGEIAQQARAALS